MSPFITNFWPCSLVKKELTLWRVVYKALVPWTWDKLLPKAQFHWRRPQTWERSEEGSMLWFTLGYNVSSKQAWFSAVQLWKGMNPVGFKTMLPRVFLRQRTETRAGRKRPWWTFLQFAHGNIFSAVVPWRRLLTGQTTDLTAHGLVTWTLWHRMIPVMCEDFDLDLPLDWGRYWNKVSCWGTTRLTSGGDDICGLKTKSWWFNKIE